MSFDFPSSPSEGQLYSPAGGPSYTFTNGAWKPAVFPLSDAPLDNFTYVRRNGVWASRGPASVVVVNLTTAGTVTPIPIPQGARTCRISGYGKPAATNTFIIFRVSKDGGTTWLAGTSDYVTQHLQATGATVSGAQTLAAAGYISTISTAATLATRPIDATLFFPPDSSEVLQWTAQSVGYNAGGIQNSNFAGYMNQLGPYTHFYIWGDTQALTGRVICEFDV
jgi:hypothetical protein